MRKKITNNLKIIFCLLALISYTDSFSSYLKNLPVTVTQPDGVVLNIFVTGTEAHNWYHDHDNYTIIQDSATKYYVFAINTPDGNVTSSSLVVGKTNPKKAGLQPGVNLSQSILAKKISKYERDRPDHIHSDKRMAAPNASKFGSQMNELVIFIRMNDQPAFTRPISYFNNNFNSLTQTSVRGFFREASQNQIDILTHFYPAQSGATVVTYNHYRPRTYYQKNTSDGYANGNPDSRDREHSLLVDAINAVKNQVPANLITDANNDGNIDNVVFIIQGSPDGWGDLLWPHRWSLFSKNVSINGKRVYDYNLTFENGSGPGVLSHELFHTFGAPDLYRYTNDDITPVGAWDLMASGNWNVPQHMNTYYKMKYGGWFSEIPVLKNPGKYTLEPISRNPFSCFQIPVPNSSQGEFLLLEYRKKEGLYENAVPGEGLIIYRILPGAKGNPGDKSDEVYVYRPGGDLYMNGSLGNAGFSSTAGRTRFDDNSNPKFFMTNGELGGFLSNLGITNVTAIGNTISFDFKGGSQNAPTVSITAPVNNAYFTAPADIIINANASVTNAAIINVEFFNGSALLGTDNTAPYTFTWSNVGSGSYTITARAIASNNIAATSAPVTVEVARPVCTLSGKKSSGTVIGTSGSWNNLGNTIEKVFDNNTATFFDATAGNNNWAGMDLSSAKFMMGVRFFPRDGFEGRMAGGKFQGSNSSDFSSVMDLYTITTAPERNAWTCVTFSPNNAFRYVRYLSPDNGFGNVSEVEFYENEIQAVCTILPYVNINKQGWTRSDDITVSPGDEVWFGPQTEEYGQTGTWGWSGPNGFQSAGRSLLLGSIQADQAGEYVVTSTVQGQCTSSKTYIIEVKGHTDCIGTVNGTAYIDTCGNCVGGTTGKVTLDTDSDSIANCVDPDDDNDGVADANDCAPLNASIKGVTTWYADADGDEYGDASIKQTACTKPAGYVSAAGDLCPIDKNKQAPGECGCGVSDADINNNGIADCKDVSSCQAVATNTSWVARNDWADQNNGSNVSTVSDGSFKITHRQWGREFLWIITSSQTIDLKKGATYEIAFDYKDQSGFTLAGMEAGFANGYSWNGPTLVQPAIAVPSGFSTSGFTGKTVSIVSNYTGKVNLAFRLKWSGQPSAAVTNYIRNIRVCEKSAAPVSMMSESPSINVYPNPASDNVTIESTGDLTGATVTLIDSYGMMHSVPVYVSGTTAALNTSSLQSGLYKLNVVTKNGLVFTNNLIIFR